MTAFVWATVTAVSPLRVKLDGDTTALAFTPDSLVDPAALSVDDRVRCELSERRVIIVGRSGGGVPFASDAQTIAGTATDLAVTPAGLASRKEAYAAAIDVASGYTIEQQRTTREGSVVSVMIRATKSGTWGTADVIGTLNLAALRPDGVDAFGGGVDNGNGAVRSCGMDTNGRLRVYGANGRSGSNSQLLSITYVTD